jgi:hypothetical protein
LIIGRKGRRENSLKAIKYSCIMFFVAMSLLASCGRGGGGDGSSTPVCMQTANMTLYTNSTGTMLLTSVTVTAVQGTPVPDVPVFVGYVSPPVAAIAAGYPPGSVDPRTVGMNITVVGTANPAEFSMTFDSALAKATYEATWRFVAMDSTFKNLLGCQDVPVTFTVQ